MEGVSPFFTGPPPSTVERQLAFDDPVIRAKVLKKVLKVVNKVYVKFLKYSFLATIKIYDNRFLGLKR